MWCWLRSLSGVQLVGRLVWRVPDGITQMCGTTIRIAGSKAWSISKASLIGLSQSNGTYYIAAWVSPKECSKKQEIELASVLRPWLWNSESRMPCSLGQSNHGLEQVTEDVLWRNDKESATIFDLLWSMTEREDWGRMSKEMVCLWTLVKWSTKLPGHWSFIYLFDQSTDCCCVFSLGQAQGCISKTE